MSPSLEYCRMPARIYLSVLGWFSLSWWGLQSMGHSVTRLELSLSFGWQWVCCVDYSFLGWCIPRIQCRWQLCICTYDIFRSTEKYFLVAKVQKPSWSTLDSIAWFKFVLHLSLTQVLFDLPLMWPWLLHTLVVSSIPCLSTSTSTLSSFMLTVCFCRFLARMLL